MQPWSAAMAEALYGPTGFYRRQVPGDHFRTSVTASPLLAEALVTLVVAVDETLGHPSRLDLVDMGAGDGGLLAALVARLPDEVAGRVRATAVELRPRPDDLDERIGWVDSAPVGVVGVVFAHEFLDNVPLDVAELDSSGTLRQVLVDPADGSEMTGPPLTDNEADWVVEWWPLSEPGTRAEVGSTRDRAWRQLLDHLGRGLAVAIDYGHRLEDRTSGGLTAGTLTGFREGHQVIPVPDGSCDLTAHVAIDSCASAGRRAGGSATALLRQGQMLRALGLRANRPPHELAHSDPAAYVAALSRSAQVAELLDPSGLGSFWWLMQCKSCEPPATVWSQVKEASPW